LAEYEITKVLVFREQQTAFTVGAIHYLHVLPPRRNIRYGDHIMPGQAQQLDKDCIDTFIDQPSHAR
jgi:hypothetical protein